MGLFNAVTFLSAFLLFQIELVIAKIFLPSYGGSYLVWGACMVFFQAVLLLGYLFAHRMIQSQGLLRYRVVHLVILSLPFLFFPGRALPDVHPQTNLPVVVDIFKQLVLTIGPAFFALSTVSLVLQSWFAQSALKEKAQPYALYSVSNLGSLLGLLTYPFLFEIFLDLDQQQTIWRLGYVVLFILNIFLFRLIPVEKEQKPATVGKTQVTSRQIWHWVLLGAAGVVLFLSVTNILTIEVAPFPLLWILPLSIFLISYILNFKENPWYPRWIRDNIHLTIGLSVLWFYLNTIGFPFLIKLVVFLLLLFLLCMYCQGELYRHKPGRREDLTLFYVATSTGGFLGGLMVSWVIPLVSVTLVEFFVGLLLLSAAIFLAAGEKNEFRPSHLRICSYTIAYLLLWPMKFAQYNVYGFILIVGFFVLAYRSLKNSPAALSFILVVTIFFSPLIETLWSKDYDFLYRFRNYYGVYKVLNYQGIRFLLNGTTMHGAQYPDPKRAWMPLVYFFPESPLGQVFIKGDFHFKKIGVIGLGVGMITTYTRPGQSLDYFELDPDDYAIAKNYFTYLKNAQSQVRYFFGDGRVSLSKIPDQTYDLFVLDAFGGDAIPVHLLTVEGLEQYRRVLNPEGIILFHISNRYIGLAPVLAANARRIGAYGVAKSIKIDAHILNFCSSDWFAMTWSKTSYDRLINTLKWKPADDLTQKRFWTDKYYNLLSIIQPNQLLHSFKLFHMFSFVDDFKALIKTGE